MYGTKVMWGKDRFKLERTAPGASSYNLRGAPVLGSCCVVQ
jgi:hypothetical protein